MFDVAPQELLLLGAVAVAVIPPKDLPRAMRFAGQWIGKARGMARHFRSGVDEMIRQAELEEIEKKWREENERIMREHPLHDAIEHPAEPVMTALPAPAPETDPVADMVIEPETAEAHMAAPPAVEPGPSAVEPASVSGRESQAAEAAPELAAQIPVEPAPKRARAPKAAPEQAEDGPELPFDLPPRQ